MSHGPTPFLVYGAVFFISTICAGILALLLSKAGNWKKTPPSTPLSALQLTPVEALHALQNQIGEIGALPPGSTEIPRSVKKLDLFLGECQMLLPDQAEDIRALRTGLDSAQGDWETLLLRLTELHAWSSQKIKELPAA